MGQEHEAMIEAAAREALRLTQLSPAEAEAEREGMEDHAHWAARLIVGAALAAREEPQRETCICQHPPEGMIGWDRGMVNWDCPLHGHEALPERRDPQMEKVVEAMRARDEHPGGEQEAWDDWYPKSPPSKRNAHRHGFNAGQAAGLIEGEAAACEDTERPVYEVERDRFGTMYSGPLEVGECVRVVPTEAVACRPASIEHFVTTRAWCPVLDKGATLADAVTQAIADGILVVRDTEQGHEVSS